MIRKIIKQGRRAYTITLPKKWVEDNNLEAGEEINLEEIDNNIIIKPTKNNNKKIKKIKIYLDNSTKENYRSIIGSLYRNEYDEILIKLKEKKQILELEKAINSIFGLELFLINEENCVIKSIYDNESTNIKLHVIRIITAIKTLQKIIEKDLKKNNLKSQEEIKEIIY